MSRHTTSSGRAEQPTLAHRRLSLLGCRDSVGPVVSPAGAQRPLSCSHASANHYCARLFHHKPHLLHSLVFMTKFKTVKDIKHLPQ